MMVVLDTNHLAELDRGSELGRRLEKRCLEAKAEMFSTIISVEEIVRGWLALLKKQRTVAAEVAVYARLQRTLKTYSDWDILPFDDDAVAVFERLKKLRLKSGTMDLKIAGIALIHDALLLSRNLVDFHKVPGLRVENWLD
jgi:tRNA(fMet)-specific endonuclease VapC